MHRRSSAALFVTRLGIPSFLVTLGMLLVVRGSALWLTSGFPQRTWSADDQWLAHRPGGRLRSSASLRIYMSADLVRPHCASRCHHVLTRTRFGNWIQATGGNPGAARNRGVPDPGG